VWDQTILGAYKGYIAQINPKSFCNKLSKFSIAIGTLLYIFLYHFSIDLKIENLVLEIWFLINHLKKGTLGCARTWSEASWIQRLIQRGAIGAIAPPKTYKSNFFTMMFYNSENSICDIRPVCRPLFCHSKVVKYTSSALQ